jgi:hypothetical protein
MSVARSNPDLDALKVIRKAVLALADLVDEGNAMLSRETRSPWPLEV